MSKLRPTGGGRLAAGVAFLRRTTTPVAALVIGAEPPLPDDWPTATGTGASDAQLGHAVGWVCEVRAADIVLLNPLGEGILRLPVPDLDDAWLHEVRSSASAAIYLLDHELGVELVVPGAASESVDAAAATAPVRAATVRTAISDAYGRPKPVGRNEPCPCGSGRKYKHCHMR